MIKHKKTSESMKNIKEYKKTLAPLKFAERDNCRYSPSELRTQDFPCDV